MKTAKRILFVSQVFPPDITAGSFRISETAMWLREMGFEVTVLTARPHRDQAIESDVHKSLEGIKVVRAPIVKIGEKGGIWYMVQFLIFMATSFLWGLIRTPWRVDYVIASSPPLFVGVPGWLLARLKRARFVLDIRDLWPDSAVAVGQLPQRVILVRLGHWLERFLYSRAELIICVSKIMQQVIVDRVNGRKRVEVIYNGVDVSFIDQSELSGSAEDHLELRTVIYAGNLGRAQGLEVLILAARQYPEVRFHLIGGGVRRRALEELAQELKLKNITFLGPFPKPKALELMSEGSALFFQLKDEQVFSTTIPSKVFDYLSVDRPILYGIRGEGAELLGKLPGNIQFEPDDVDSLVRAISELNTQYPHYLRLAQENSSLLKSFSRDTMSRKLANLLIEIS